MTSIETAALAARLKQGEAQAWEEFVNAFRARAILHFRVNGCDVHEANDLAQEACLRAYTGIEGLRNGTSLPAWFDTIVRRVRVSRCAISGQTLSLTEMDVVEFKPQPPADDPPGESSSEFRWDGLKPEDRELIMLRYVNDLTEREIAEITGLSRVVVKLRLQRIRRKLRADVEDTPAQGNP